MSDADSTERIIARAAAGQLPDWAECGPERRAHAARVAALLDDWAARLALPAAERRRWRAAGVLHDALRDADPNALRDLVPDGARALPDPVLHGPATAVRLAEDGVRDRSLLDAIAHHTLGHPGLDRLGLALYLADYLEPGRSFDPVGRTALRARMPGAFDAVVKEVVAVRIGHRLRVGGRVAIETIELWNRFARCD